MLVHKNVVNVVDEHEESVKQSHNLQKQSGWYHHTSSLQKKRFVGKVTFFIVRWHSEDYAVQKSVCPSHAGIVSKRLNLS